MTDASKELADVKKMVHSLLISSPIDLPVRQLLQDYHTFIGKPLDYRSLGYATPENFFRDLNDTVSIDWRNGSMTLRAVTNEKTRHIENLVLRQKKPSKKKILSYYREPRRSYSDYGRSNNDYGRPPRLMRGAPHPPPKIVPAYIRRQIVSLFRSYPDGLSMSHFDAAFVRHYGSRINFANYGFTSWEEFLHSLTDVISVEEMYGEWRLKLVDYHHTTASSQHTSRVDKENKPDLMSINTNSGYSQSNSTKESTRVRRPSKGRGRRREHSGNSDTTVGSAKSESSSGSNDSQRILDIQDKLELEIQQVLEDKPDGVWACKFAEEFQAKHGRPLDFTQHGYLSVVEFVSSSNSVHIERPTPKGDWKLYDSRIYHLKAKDNQPEDRKKPNQSDTQLLETQTKESIHNLLKSCPKGIPMNDFPAFYKWKMGSDIPVEELGFETAQQYILSLADSIIQIRYAGRGVTMMYCEDAYTQQYELIPPLDVDKPPQADYPIDVVGPGCHYTPEMCPNAEGYTGLFVSNIINPGLFWVILRHKQKALALEQLMNAIDEFYNSLSSKEYTLPESLAVPGQVCATLFPEDNNWHRGVITKVNEEGFAGVYYVDYGNTAFVSKKAIKFLKSDFLKLPAQAIQSRLANIVPTSGKWKVKSRNRLLELVKDRPLVAYVTKVKTQVLSLCLTDTNDPNVDIHVNDVLVKDGYAKFQPDDEIPNHITKDQHKEVPDYCHVFGWNTDKPPRLPHAAGVNLQQDTANSGNIPASTPGYCYVKWLQLTQERVIHLINLERVPYVVSAELSSFIWEEDVLASMLKRRHVDAGKRLVNSDEYPQLFQELAKYNVKSFSAEMLSKRKLVSLYELNSVPTILRTFLEEDIELIDAVQELITKFDPDSPYWKTEEDDQEPEEEEESAELEPEGGVDDLEEETADMEEAIDLSQEEKQMLLRALQFKRKRFLQTLMSDPDSSNDLVNELNECEARIMVLKQQIVDDKHESSKQPSLKKTETLKEKVSVTLPPMPTSSNSREGKPTAGTQVNDGTDKSAENQRVIQNIMNSTTKPIATADIVTKPTTSMTVSGTGSSVSNSKPVDLQQQYVTQSQIGSHPGMMGISPHHQPGIPNPMWMLQPGMVPNPRFNNLQNLNQMLGAGGPVNMDQAMTPFFPQGFPQAPLMNPMFNAQLQFPPNQGVNMVQGQMNQHGSVPTVGRGQPMGILPGLLPLFQNLTVGRGRGTQ